MKRVFLLMILLLMAMLVACNTEEDINIQQQGKADKDIQPTEELYINEQIMVEAETISDEEKYHTYKQIVVNDGFIVLSESISTENIYVAQYDITKYDKALNKIWNKNLGEFNSGNGSYDLILSGKNSFYFINSKTQNYIDVIEKFDLDGNIIWKKTNISGDGNYYVGNNGIIMIRPEDVVFVSGETGDFKVQFSFKDLSEKIRELKNRDIDETDFYSSNDFCVNDEGILFKFHYDNSNQVEFNEMEILINTDFNGNIKWIEELEGKLGYTIVREIIPDGKTFLILKNNAYENNIEIIKYDEDGKQVWTCQNLERSIENTAQQFTKFMDKYLYVVEANDEFEKVYLINKDGNLRYTKIYKNRLKHPLYNLWQLGNEHFIDDTNLAMLYDGYLEKYIIIKYDFSQE